MEDSKSEQTADFHAQQSQLEWLHAIVWSINDGILVVDNQGIVQFINPEYTNITGVRAEEIIGKHLRDVRPGAQLLEVMSDGRSRSGIYRSEGDTEYVVDMAPIMVHGQIVGGVSVCKAVNEVYILNQELASHKEKLGRLQKTVGSLHRAKYSFHHIVGNAEGLREVIAVAKKSADAHLPVLITGESGTGKELIAQAIHNASRRAHRPFIPVNCSAIPAELIESELFGYEEGAFTNAKKGGKTGLFELADEGTIFLDEIGDLPYGLQAKLLRVLQEQTIRRVGDTKERHIDVRVIAATNRDLRQLMFKARFREDLFYRLNVINLQLPPLRERKSDIPLLIQALLRNIPLGHDGTETSIRADAMETLMRYDWPGNIRELKNAIEYATCISPTTEITVDSLPETIPRVGMEPVHPGRPLKEMTRSFEQTVIIQAIEKYGDSMEGKKQAAQSLGISLATLYNKLGLSR